MHDVVIFDLEFTAGRLDGASLVETRRIPRSRANRAIKFDTVSLTQTAEFNVLAKPRLIRFFRLLEN